MDGEKPDPKYVELELATTDIVARPGNRPPRKVEELAAAIAAKGLLNRILVRKRVPGKNDLHPFSVYELIAGERRLRAHELLGRKAIPAKVYDVDDREAEELAAIDNIDREDLTALEEGDVYVSLIQRRIVPDVVELARRVGKTETHVRQRMRLTTLVPAIRKLLEADLLDIGAALAIAQTPEAVQKKLAPLLDKAAEGKAVVDTYYLRRGAAQAGRISREVVQHLLREHVRELASAPFDIASTTLNPKAGPCGTCPKRSGVQGTLTEVLDRADTCLDGACWDVKVEAHVAEKREEDKRAGLRVLSEAEAKKILTNDGRTQHAAAFKAVGEEVNDGTGNYVPVTKLVDAETPRVVAFTPGGQRVELVPTKHVDAALEQRAAAKKKAGPKATERDVESAGARDERKRLERVKVLKRSRDLALRQVASAITSRKVSIDTALRVVVARTKNDEAEHVCKARGIAAKPKMGGGAHVDAVTELAATIVDETRVASKVPENGIRELVALVTQLAVGSSVDTFSHSTGDQKTPPELVTFGIDLDALRRAAKAELALEADEREAKKRAPKPAKASPRPKTKGASIRAGGGRR